ncbi:MAG: helix-turn-helix domain-containing protein [Nitrospinales bacterium]
MTILAENLKTIRKGLNCTQMAVSDVLDIGFRTYVRYEAGERDAPISVLVKIARLGNISLDRMLTSKITPEDLKYPDIATPPEQSENLEVIGGSLEKGRLNFKGLIDDFYVATNNNEKKLLNTFRKMDRVKKEKCLLEAEWLLKNSRPQKTNDSKKISKKSFNAKNKNTLKKITNSINKITLKG